MHPFFFLFFLLSLLNNTGALPLPTPSVNDTELVFNDRVLNNGVQLRILPLGASIVYGLKSSDGNGFRYGLRNQLVDNGNPVNFVGSNHGGSMIDNECEAWPGYTIDQVAQKAELSIPSQPNLVLLHVGTNDAVQNLDIQNAGNRLGSLIDRLFDAIPGVTVVASTLLSNANSQTQANVAIYNRKIPDVVQTRQAQGKQIVYVDFSSSYFSLSDLSSDGTHPTDAGYLKMAEVWYQGIAAADSRGWLSLLKDDISDVVSGGSNNTCDKVPGAAVGPTKTQMGSGTDDGPYVHASTQVDGFAGSKNPSDVNFDNPLPEGVFWADIDGDGIDDYVYLGSESNFGIGVSLSLGDGKMGKYIWSDFSPTCKRQGITFADMTGDGRDDFCCIGPDGGVTCWQNTKGADPRVPKWVAMGTVKESEGFPQAQVRLADLDGDGRADYIVFDADAKNIYGWRNGALSNSAPAYWYPMQGVFKDLPSHALAEWDFVDLNGDGKADLVWINGNGQVTSWINHRGYSVGLGPEWVSQGITHHGSDHPVNVTFGAFMGSSRADYALASIKDGNVYIDRWENRGHGGTMVKGDGVRYCDMTGSGSDGYIFVDATGSIHLFENIHDWGHWNDRDVIYNANRPRQEIHLADFDGDSKCDILLVDKTSGATRVLLNEYDGSKFAFKDIGIVTGHATCAEGYGQSKHDLGVRWHDLTGDGRADFLCVQPDGTVHGFINKGVNDFVDQGVIKDSEGRERANIRFADMNGDSRDDLVYVNMTDGAVTAWYNDGWNPSAKNAFLWNSQGIVSPGGFSRGSTIEFGNLNGLGRADYISVKPSTNEAWTWFNVCPGSEGPAPPNLPSNAPPVPTVIPNTQSSATSMASSAQSGPISSSIAAGIFTTTVKDSKGSTVVETITGSATTSTGSTNLGSTSNAEVLTTTATDSAGSTVVGFITKESTTASENLATSNLPTFTEFPISVSYESTSVGYNTRDPEGHPVLGPWPLCWFCPPGSEGTVIIGLPPGPGVYPPPRPGGPPGPPGFSISFPTITIGPNGNPTYKSSPEPTPEPTASPTESVSERSTSSSSSSCSTRTVTQITYYVSYKTDDRGSTIGTATTSTYSTDVSGCTVTATTATSTTAGAPFKICQPGTCSGCNTQRDVLPAVKSHDSRKLIHGLAQNFTVAERSLPDDSVLQELYDAVWDDKPLLVNVEHEIRWQGKASSRFKEFAEKDTRLYVEKLAGCTSLMVVSRRGAWVSHFWETDFIWGGFQEEVLDYIQMGRVAELGRPAEEKTVPLASVVASHFSEHDKPRIFIMTPANTEPDVDKMTSREIFATLGRGDYTPLFGPHGDFGRSMDKPKDRITPLQQFLSTLLPRVPIDIFAYKARRQTGEKRIAPFGAGMVLYSSNQISIDDNGDDVIPDRQQATWQCWMQGKLMGSDTWDATPEQITPAATPSSSTATASSTSRVGETTGTPDPSPTDATTRGSDVPTSPTNGVSSTPKSSFSPKPTASSPTGASPTGDTSSPASTTNSVPATSTKATHLPLPTITDITFGERYCLAPHDGDYVRFSRGDAQAVVSHFCNTNPILEPDSKGVTDFHADNAGNVVHISAKWADDQTGCEPITQSFHFAEPHNGVLDKDDTCLMVWDGDYYCTPSSDQDTDMSYGGGFVLSTTNYGCIEFMQWSSPAPVDANMRNTSPGDSKNLTFDPITINLEAYDGRYGNLSMDGIAKVPHLFDIVGV